MKKLNLKFKLTIFFLACGIIPLLLLIGLISYNLSQSDLGFEESSFNQLKSINAIKKAQMEQYFAERRGDMQVLIETVDVLRREAVGKLILNRQAKKVQIERFFAERLGDIKVLANDPFVVNAYQELEKAFVDAGGHKSGRFRGLNKERFEAPANYKEIHERWFETFKYYTKQYEYYDLFLITPNSGETIFTIAKEGDFAERVTAYESSLKNVWEKARDGRAVISDMKSYAPSGGLPAQFVAAPIKDSGKTIGIIALQISNDKINAIMKERTGMKKTEEAYLVGSDYLMRSDSFLEPENHNVVSSFKNPAKGSAKTEAVKKALAGKSGAEVIIDYLGHPVLSAYTMVNVGSEVSWALLAEIDVAEAFSPQDASGKFFFEKYREIYGYYDLFLINPDGFAFWTATREADYHTNLVNGKYSSSNLGKLVRQVLQTRKFQMVDFAPYAPSGGEPAAFIAEPIIFDGKIEMVVALQLPLGAVNKIMQERTGMGRTGETYLIGPDKLMRSDSYLDKVSHSVKASFADPSKGSVDTEASRMALSGKTGSKIIIDYNGNPVLSVFAPLKVFDYTWAIIAEIDEAEAFAGIRTLEKMIFGFFVIIGVVMAFIGFYFGRGIANPILRIASNLSNAAQQVASVSSQSSGAAMQLSQASNEQASSIQETSASLEEMTAMVDNTVTSSERSNALSEEMKTASVEGNKSMQDLIGSMNEILTSNENIQELTKVVGEIGEKTAVIDEIVFQTKLLSFNASVEAERAGEHGRGFAVVAQEVGNLAQMSGKAASEISSIVKESIKNAETITSQNRSKVEKGNELVKNTAAILDALANKAKRVSEDTKQIFNASRDQSNGIKQINNAVAQLDKTTQANASSSEETASSAEQMNAQAQLLHEQVIALTNLVNGKSDDGDLRLVHQSKDVKERKVPKSQKPKLVKKELAQGSLKVDNHNHTLKKAVGAEELSRNDESNPDDEAWDTL